MDKEENLLGKGAFGKVIKLKEKTSQEYHAIKFITINEEKGISEAGVLDEIKILQKLT